MNQRRRSSGIPLPTLNQLLLTGVAVCVCAVLWIEYRQRLLSTITGKRLPTNAVDRIQAIEALVARGPSAMPELLERLSNVDPNVRSMALYGLGRLKQADSLPAVRARLTDADPEVRRTALTTFGWICEDQEDQIAVAAQMVGDPHVATRNLAVQMLDSYGSVSIPRALDLVHSPDSAVRTAAVGLLMTIDRRRHDPAEVNAILRGVLGDEDPQVRQSAVEAITARGAATVDDAGAWLRDENPNVVNAGYQAVYSLGDNAAALLPQLQDRMADVDARFPHQLRVMRALKNAATPAVPNVLQLVPSLSPAAKVDAVETLHVMGAQTSQLERLLMPLLSDGDAQVRVAAGNVLVQISPEQARRQAAALVRELERKESSLDGPDLDALLGLGAKAQTAVPLLIRLLSHRNEDVVRQALLVLHELGEAASPAVPTLLSMLRHADLTKSQFVLRTLGGIGPAARPVVPQLLGLLNQPIPHTFLMSLSPIWPARQRAAAWALGRIGDDSPAALAALRHQAKVAITMEPFMLGESVALRRTVLESLTKLTPNAEDLLDDLLLLLDDRADPIRMQAALAIGALPGDRRPAVEPLSAALFDRDCYVRTAVALALQAIGPAAERARPALTEAANDTRNSVPNWLAGRRRNSRFGAGLPADDLEDLSVAIAARRALDAISAPAADEGVAAH